MAEGIKATVEFADSDICPIASLSADDDVEVGTVSVNVCHKGCGTSTTNFTTYGGCPLEIHGEHIFSDGSVDVYRIVHDDEINCPCECLGSHPNIAVDKYVAKDGVITLTFYAGGYEELREAISSLRERFPSINVKRFARTSDRRSSEETVHFDRSRLTARQFEVLRTAYDMGYFERPRRANATEIVDEIGISPSTFTEHLKAAQNKILKDILQE